MYGDGKSAKMQKVIEQLQGLQSGEEIITMGKAGGNVNFYLTSSPAMHHSRVIGSNGFDEYITVFYEMIIYFIEGKLMTEGIDDSFRYFENIVRLQKEQYPIVECVRIMESS